MINIAEIKDIENLWSEIIKINDRTKKHTIQIKELQKELKDKNARK